MSKLLNRPSSEGRAFQSRGPAEEKALSPYLDLVLGIFKLRSSNFRISWKISLRLFSCTLSKVNELHMYEWIFCDLQSRLITYKSCRVVFGLTSSPFLLNSVIANHLKTHESEFPCIKWLDLYNNNIYG